MKKNIVLVILSVMVGLFAVLFAAEGVAVGFGRDQVIHVLNGKTGAEYSKVVEDLDTANGQIGDLQSQIGDLNGQIGDLNGQIGDLKGQIKKLNSTVTGLQGQLSSWKSILCAHTWAEATDPNIALVLNNTDGSLRKVFNILGFDAYGTQWKTNFNPNFPFELLVKPLGGNIILDVSKQCVILKSAVGQPI